MVGEKERKKRKERRGATRKDRSEFLRGFAKRNTGKIEVETHDGCDVRDTSERERGGKDR